MASEMEFPEFDETVAAGQAEAEGQVTETTTEQDAPETVVEETPVVNPLFEEARSAGLEFGEDITDSDGLARFLLQQYSQVKPYAEFGRSTLAQQAPNPLDRRDQPVAGEETDNEAEPAFDEHKFFSEAWSVPSLSQGAQWALKHGVFVEGKGGLLEAAPGLEQAALPYVKEVNDYQQARAALHESFSENPLKFVLEKGLPYLRHHLSQEFQQLSQQSVQTFEQQSFVDKFKAENAAWMYNAQGTNFSPHGQKFNDLVMKYEPKLGLQEATQLALQLMPPPTKEGGDPKDQQARTATAAPSKERERDEKGQFVKPAGKPAPAPPVAKPASFVDKAKQRAMASHAAIGAAPENTVVASEGDLDNLWTAGWAAHAGAN